MIRVLKSCCRISTTKPRFYWDRKILRQGDNFDLNPFSGSDQDLLGLNSTFRNSLFYNRGKQNHSVTYTFITARNKNLLTTGAIENTNRSHQLQYQHLLKKSWLFDVNGKTISSETTTENYASRNYKIEGFMAGPKISYLFSKNASWDVFCEFQHKNNRIGALETLKQQRLGTSFTYSDKNSLPLKRGIFAV